jgi:hypothetical protein
MNIVFEDANTLIYGDESGTSQIWVDMEVKVGQRLNWATDGGAAQNFLDHTRSGSNGRDLGGVVGFSSLELVNDVGTVVAHYEWGWSGGAMYPDAYKQRNGWVAGADNDPNAPLGKFLFTVRNSIVVEDSQGFCNNAYHLSEATGKLEDYGKGIAIKTPTEYVGHLRWTIREMDICQDDYWSASSRKKIWMDYFVADDWSATQDLYGIFINNVSLSTSDVTGQPLIEDDVVYTSRININAESAMEEVTLKVCNSYEAGMAIGNGDLLNAVTEKPIKGSENYFVRKVGYTWVFSNLEKLLIRSYHSNFTGRFIRFEVETQYALPCAGMVCQYGRYTQGAKKGEWIFGDFDTWFLIVGQEWDVKSGKSRLVCVQVSRDNKSIIDNE